MPDRRLKRVVALSLFVIGGLILSMCAGPAASPTAAPTATALPPTATVAIANTPAASANLPVPATSIRLNYPESIAFDADGNMYVGHCGGAPRVILRIDQFNLLSRFAGSDTAGFSGDGGPALGADIGCIGDMAFDRDGNFFFADIATNRVRRIDRNGIITTVAGSGSSDFLAGSYGGDGGPATEALLDRPTSIAFDAAGNLYIADSGNDRIRKVDRQGVITTIAGTGEAGFSGDGGPATGANLYLPNQHHIPYSCGTGIAFDAEGNLYISDTFNSRIRKVDAQGVITTVAGTGEPGASGDDGLATVAQLACPSGITFDSRGNLYVAVATSPEIEDNRIRKIDTNGIITTVAGIGQEGFAGDGGPATSAELRQPWSVRFDPAGNMVIADTYNSRIRRVDQNGIITTVVGGLP